MTSVGRVPVSVIRQAVSWSRFDSYWDTSLCKQRSDTWDVNSAFTMRSMTGSGSNRIQRDLRRFHLTGRLVTTNLVSVNALAIWCSSRRIPPEKCVRFACQESGAHSFGRLAAIARAQYQPWREAANPAASQRANGLAPWQRVCESGAPPLSPARNDSRKYQRMP